MRTINYTNTGMEGLDTKSVLYAVVGLLLGSAISFTVVSVHLGRTQGSDAGDLAQSQRTGTIQTKYGSDFDKEYIDVLIESNEELINMATEARIKSGSNTIKSISDSIIDEKGEEIDRLKQIKQQEGLE